MKVEKIETTVYEIGDVVDVSKLAKSERYSDPVTKGARWALIIKVTALHDGFYCYRAVADTGRALSIRGEDLKNIKYKGHVDLDLLFAESEGD